jgi:hypothetical protein
LCSNISENDNEHGREDIEITVPVPPLQLELRLAEHIGQGIRYRLRVLFNPAPPRLCNLDTQYEHRSTSYSKVSQLITMTKRTNHDGYGLAVDDGFLSALISRALCRLYEYYKLHDMILTSDCDDTSLLVFLSGIPNEFCTSEPSHRTMSPRSIRSINFINEFTENDRDLVIADIQEATSFLCATYAVRFLYDLFTTPGVYDEVQRMGGWDDIEQYAITSKKYKLYNLCSADAHFVPLWNYKALVQLLSTFCNHMECKTQCCIDALKMVATNYRIPIPPKTSSSAKNIIPKRQLHQYMIDITNTYTDMMMEVYAFPEIIQQPPSPSHEP